MNNNLAVLIKITLIFKKYLSYDFSILIIVTRLIQRSILT